MVFDEVVFDEDVFDDLLSFLELEELLSDFADEDFVFDEVVPEDLSSEADEVVFEVLSDFDSVSDFDLESDFEVFSDFDSASAFEVSSSLTALSSEPSTFAFSPPFS